MRYNSGLDTVVGIATRYGLGCPGIKSPGEGTIFSAAARTGRAFHTSSYAMRTVSFLEANRTGRGFEQTFPSTDEVKERVEL